MIALQQKGILWRHCKAQSLPAALLKDLSSLLVDDCSTNILKYTVCVWVFAQKCFFVFMDQGTEFGSRRAPVMGEAAVAPPRLSR